MTEMKIRVCDICPATSLDEIIKTKNIYWKSVFDGHRNESEAVTIDLCEKCEKIIESVKKAILIDKNLNDKEPYESLDSDVPLAIVNYIKRTKKSL